jgi:3alpha(or 20beta)-hydroxysteroid dehydrogenase
MAQLAGKIALITGAARGQGAAEARLFAAEGAKVIMTDLLTDEGAEVAAAIGDAALFLRHDVSSEADWDRVVAEGVRHFGGLDILVNNAGITKAGSVESTSMADYMSMVMVNQVGVFLGMKSVLPALKARGGAIVNISSTAGIYGSKVAFAYSASKWAVRGMTKSAALEFAPYKIRVNSVHPGLIETEMTRPLMDSHLTEAVKRIPLGRIGQPDDIAKLVAFLASDASSFTTGVEFIVDGGATTNH